MNFRLWLGWLILCSGWAVSASATVVEFATPGDLSLFNQDTGDGSLVWSGVAGVGGGGGLTTPDFHKATYGAESFSLGEPNDTITLSTFFRTGEIGLVGSGFRETYGEVYLTPNPDGYPFDDDAAFVEIGRNTANDFISGGPLQAGGGSFPGFTVNFPVGTLQSSRWYKLGVEYELLASNQLGWDIHVEDFGATGLSSLGDVMSSNRVTADTLGFRFDPTLYAGFSAIGGSTRVTAIDNFSVEVPAGPGGQLAIGSTFDVAYQPGSVASLTDGETTLQIGGIAGSSSLPEERPIFEFPLGDIPPGARIVSAQLRVDTGSSSGAPRIAVTGFEGDGLASLADGTVVGPLVALTGGTSCCGDEVIPLFTNFVQALASRGASHLGLRLRSVDLPQYVAITADEATIGPGPVLELQFSTAAAEGDYTGDGLATAADYTVWRNTLGSRADLQADGDGDGVVGNGDYSVWKSRFGAAPPLGVVNGDFAAGNLSGWETVATPNSDISVGFPRVESFDVDGDGTGSPAMRIRAGQDDFLSGEVAGGGLEQLIYLEAGDYTVAADIASTNLSAGGNTAPGRFELWLAGQLVDVVDMNGTSIAGGQTRRDTLLGTAFDVAPGWYDLEVRFLRPAVNSVAIYGYFDNIRFATSDALATAVPEPASVTLLMGLGACVAVRRRAAAFRMR